MSLTPRLDLRQTQSLTMTPRLQQAIRLLQMSSQELEAAVAEELEKNPFLEREGAAGEDGFTDYYDASETAERIGRDEMPALLDSVDGGRESPLDTDDGGSEDSFYEQADAEEREASGEADFSVDAWSGAGGSAAEEGFNAVDLCAARAPSLVEEMSVRINTAFFDPEDRKTALLLTEMLDERGYLSQDADAGKTGRSDEDFNRILDTLQKIAPTGVYARSLAECLALQLKEQNRFDPAIAALLEHLDWAALKDFKKLSAVCGVNESEVRDMLEEIKRLSPHPASAYDASPVSFVVPDVLVRRDKTGGFSVSLNQAALPRLLINRRYVAEISSAAASDKEAKKFLNGHLSSANWLVKALNQRAETILKVAAEIVDRQKAFFDKGERALVPMVLKDVADAAGLHESTVSRVTAGKYLAAPSGVFELKSFFSQGLETASGDSCSARSVRHRIRELVDGEGVNVLSDDSLCVLLNREGIEIARRTVAKYREAMGIPSSSLRKREKRAGK